MHYWDKIIKNLPLTTIKWTKIDTISASRLLLVRYEFIDFKHLQTKLNDVHGGQDPVVQRLVSTNLPVL